MGSDALPGLDFYATLMAGEEPPSLAQLFPPRPGWMRDALCREYPEVNFFPGRGTPTDEAKAVCDLLNPRPGGPTR